MKRLTLLLVAAIAVALPLGAQLGAQDAPVRLAFVDSQALIATHPAGQAANDLRVLATEEIGGLRDRLDALQAKARGEGLSNEEAELFNVLLATYDSVQARYAADIAQERGITRWMTCSPDYAYGRDNTAEFLDYLKVFASEVEVVDQAWPKLFEPDYTAFVTRILQVRPQAIYSALWGGDLVAFIEQGNLYGLFGGDLQYFSGGLADPPVVGAIKQVPAGLNSVYRYDANFPDNPANREFDEKYFALTGQHPTNWSWQNYTAMQFVFEALRRTNGDTDGKALAAEMKDLEIDSPFSATGKMTMRGEDHTIIDYPVAWGKSVSSPPSFADWVCSDWGEIQEHEKEWKQQQGYT